ncbi:TPA: hypothetical protein J1320_001653 [Escherichia coli]|nr:hypothetical protein [Escherichia coli]
MMKVSFATFFLVHCRTGSLEMDADDLSDEEKGSLPYRQLRNRQVNPVRHPAGSLPYRQLRKNTAFDGFVVAMFTAVQAA